MSRDERKLRLRCPECKAHYSFPKEKLGSKPLRLRCAKCETIFTVARRDSVPPRELVGFQYNDFSGEFSRVPSEFAFLSPVSREIPEVSRSSPASSGEETPKSSSGDDDITGRIKQVDSARKSGGLFGEIESTSSDREDTDTQRLCTGSEPRDGDDTAWFDKEPVSLEDYALHQETDKTRFWGKIAMGFVGAVLLFLLFVAFRNGGISLPKFGDQVAFAFSGETLEDLPEEVEALETTIYQKKVIFADDGRGFVVVTGEVHNSSSTDRVGILLRGRALDENGELKGEVEVPCGHVLEDAAIKAAGKSAMDAYLPGGAEYRGCNIKSNSTGVFQLIFDSPMSGDNDYSTILVQVIAAQYPG